MADFVDETLRDVLIAIYSAVREAWLHHGFGPSQEELAAATGYSLTAVHNALKELRKRGHLTFQKGVPRSVKPVDMERRLLRQPRDPWDTLTDEPVYWEESE